MKVITFTNQKGGVGKTTSAVNIAAAVANEGRRVLLIDIDAQGNATSGLGAMAQKQSLTKSIYTIMVGKSTLAEAAMPTHVLNLDLVPSNKDLSGAETELLKAGVTARETILKRALATVSDKYDFVFIDCPPTLGLLTINALTASNSLIVPVQSEFYALEGLSQLMYTIDRVKKYLNPGLEIEGILLTMYDQKTKLSKEVEDEVKRFFAAKVYKTRIPRNIKLAEAPSHGLTIFEYDKNSSGAKAYEDVTAEFLKKNR